MVAVVVLNAVGFIAYRSKARSEAATPAQANRTDAPPATANTIARDPAAIQAKPIDSPPVHTDEKTLVSPATPKPIPARPIVRPHPIARAPVHRMQQGAAPPGPPAAPKPAPSEPAPAQQNPDVMQKMEANPYKRGE